MLENSQPTNLIGYERRLKAYTTLHDIAMGKSKIQRLALKLHKRQARMLDEDLTRYITYSDPVGESVATNVDAGRTALRHSNKKNGLEAQSAKICFEAVRAKVSERV